VSSPSIQELVRAARKTVRDEIDAVEAEIARHLLAKYNPDQPRDEHGRFGSGSGGSEFKTQKEVDALRRRVGRTAIDFEGRIIEDVPSLRNFNAASRKSVLVGSYMKTPVDQLLREMPYAKNAIDANLTRTIPKERLKELATGATPTKEETALVKTFYAYRIEQGWYGDSGNQSHAPIQEGARAEFNLKDAAPTYNKTGEYIWGDAQPDLARVPQSIMRDYLRAQYDVTQAVFKEAGYSPNDTIRMSRVATAEGAGFSPNAKAGDTSTASFRPVTSWSADPKYDPTYLQGPLQILDNPPAFVPYRADVPIRDIASTPSTGMGDYTSNEYIVLGGKRDVTASGRARDYYNPYEKGRLAKYNPDQPRDERGRFGSGNGESSSSAEGKIPKFKTWDDVKEWGEKNDIRIDTKALADESHMTPEAMARVCGRIDAMDAKFPGLKKELTRIDSYPNAGKSTLAATRSDNMTAGSFQVHLGSSLLIPAKLGDAYANPEEFKASMLGNLKFSNNGAPRWSSCFGDSPDDTINHELGHVIQNMMSADGRLAEPKSNWNTKTNPYVAAASDAGWLTRTGKTSQGPNISFGAGYNISAYASTNPTECHAEALSLMQRPDLLAQMSQEQQDSFKVYVESLNKRAGTTVIKEQAEDTSGGIIEDDFGLSDEFWQQFYNSVNKKTNKANATDTLKAWLAKYNPDEERDSSGKWTSGGGDEEAPKVMDWQRIGESNWYETRNKAADWMESHVDSVISMGGDIGSEPLTRAELAALDNYRQSGYEDLNDHLRAGGSINNDPDGIGKTLQGAFQHSETNEPVVVFRGLTKFQPDANVGDVITDRGFPSTTLAESVARQAFSQYQAESQVMQINLPTGTPAIGIAGYESEILLPAGSQFRVDAKPDAGGGKWVVTYVGQAAVKSLAKTQVGRRSAGSKFAWGEGDIEIAKPAKKSSDSDKFTPPRGVREEARRAVEWIKEGHAGANFTPVGRGRAGDLAIGRSVSLDIIKRMASYLARHEVDKKGQGWSPGEDGYPSPGRVAWAAWGGDAAVSWTNGILKNNNVAKYSPDEERDERGRWTGGGIDGRNLGRDEITVKRGLGDLKSGDFFVHGGVIHEYLGRNGGYHWARQVNSDGTRGEMESVGSTKRVALAEGAGVAQVSEEAVRSRIKKSATETLKAWVAKYSPDEERDERGRWTGGDGTSMSSKEIADRIAAGKSTTIDRSQVADLAKYVASHEDPATRANPQYDKGDLTKLHLTDGKDVFAQGSKTGMYQRSEMPQIPGSAKPALLESLSQAGIGVTREQVDPSGLKPSQRDYSIAGASGQHEYLDSKGMFGNGVTPKDGDRILVSKDNYIIDRHHRWAAYQMEAMSNPDVKIPVIRIGATRDELIGSGDANGIINKFADSKGLEQRGLGVVSRSAASKAIRVHGDIEFDSDDPRDKTFLDHLDRLGDKDQNAKPFVWNKDHPVEDFGDATKGDVAGHEFHGNQWTGGGGDGERAMPANDSTRMDNAPESVQQLDRQVGEGSEYKQFVTENDNGSGCDDIAQAVERDFGIKQVYGTFTTKDGTTEDHSWNVTPEGWIVDGAQYVFNQNGDSSSRFNYYAPGAPQFKEGTGWQFKSESPAIKGDGVQEAKPVLERKLTETAKKAERIATLYAAAREQITAEINAVESEVAKYNPDQPRDPDGRFASGGGDPSGAASSEFPTAKDHAAAGNFESAEMWMDAHLTSLDFTRNGNYRNLTEKQEEAIDKYARNDHRETNEALREGRTDPNGIARYLRAAINRNTITEPITVWRSGWPLQIGAKVGDIVQDKGFVSTYHDRETTSWPRATAYDVRIQLPKGTNCVHGSFEEKEIILGAGSQFKVVSIDKSPPTEAGIVGPDVVTVRYVGNAAKALHGVEDETATEIRKSTSRDKYTWEDGDIIIVSRAAKEYNPDQPRKDGAIKDEMSGDSLIAALYKKAKAEIDAEIAHVEKEIIKAKARRTKSKQWEVHAVRKYEEALIEYYKPKLAQALRDGFRGISVAVAAAKRNYDLMQETTEKASSSGAAAEGTAAQAAARAAVSNHLTVSQKDAQRILNYIYGDSFSTGAHAAALTLGSQVTAPSTVDDILGAGYWDTWEPGNAAAADLVRTGALDEWLSNIGLSPEAMAADILSTAQDRLTNALADGLDQGLSADAIASNLSDVVSGNADTIAITEIGRAQSAGTADTYTELGIQQYNWLADPNACKDSKSRVGCASLADGGPYDMPPDESGDNEDQPAQPWHPNCRCTYLPVLPDASGDNIAPTSDQADQQIFTDLPTDTNGIDTMQTGESA